jgi:hypothetical protein
LNWMNGMRSLYSFRQSPWWVMIY